MVTDEVWDVTPWPGGAGGRAWKLPAARGHKFLETHRSVSASFDGYHLMRLSKTMARNQMLSLKAGTTSRNQLQRLLLKSVNKESLYYICLKIGTLCWTVIK